MNQRLYRSRDERILAGVAGGVAEQFHADPSLVRVLWVILIPLTGGLALVLYIIMAFVVPEEPAGDARWAAWERQSGGYQWPDLSTAGGGGAGAAGGTDARASGVGTAGAGTAAGAGSGPSSWVAPPTSPTPGMTPTSPAAPSNPSWPGDWRAARDARRDARRAARGEHWDGSGAILFGLILIVVGGFFFARAYLPDIDANRSWPIVVLVLGAILLVGSIRRGSDHSG